MKAFFEKQKVENEKEVTIAKKCLTNLYYDFLKMDIFWMSKNDIRKFKSR